MQESNLNTKCITEFTPGDTIYMTVSTERGKNSVMYLCEFVRLEGPFVVGRKIKAMVNERVHEREAGEEIKVRLDACALYGENPVTGHTHYHGFKSTGYALYPSEKMSENGGTVKNHPSYGMIGFTHGNINGNGRTLFGSKLYHNDVITLTIKAAELDRHLNNDWYHAKDTLIEVNMSATQFAEFITRPNRGDGVPCTVTKVMGTSMPDPPTDAMLHKHNEEFKASMQNMTVDMREKLDQLSKILGKASIGKQDREDIKSLFDGFLRDIESKIPFIHKQFGEALDKAVQSSKIEIETFAASRGINGSSMLNIGPIDNEPDEPDAEHN